MDIIANDLEGQLVAKNSCYEALPLAHHRHVQTMLSYKHLGKRFYRVTIQINHWPPKQYKNWVCFRVHKYVSTASPDNNYYYYYKWRALESLCILHAASASLTVKISKIPKEIHVLRFCLSRQKHAKT